MILHIKKTIQVIEPMIIIVLSVLYLVVKRQG